MNDLHGLATASCDTKDSCCNVTAVSEKLSLARLAQDANQIEIEMSLIPKITTSLSLPVLKAECKHRDVVGWRKMKKDEMLAKLGLGTIAITLTKEYMMLNPIRPQTNGSAQVNAIVVETVASQGAGTEADAGTKTDDDVNVIDLSGLPLVTLSLSLPVLKTECKYRAVDGWRKMKKAEMMIALGLGTVVTTLTPEYLLQHPTSAGPIQQRQLDVDGDREQIDGAADDESEPEYLSNDNGDLKTQNHCEPIDLCSCDESCYSDSSGSEEDEKDEQKETEENATSVDKSTFPFVDESLSLKQLKAEYLFRHCGDNIKHFDLTMSDALEHLGVGTIAITLTMEYAAWRKLEAVSNTADISAYATHARVTKLMPLSALKDECRCRGVVGYSKMNKDALLETLGLDSIALTLSDEYSAFKQLCVVGEEDWKKYIALKIASITQAAKDKALVAAGTLTDPMVDDSYTLKDGELVIRSVAHECNLTAVFGKMEGRRFNSGLQRCEECYNNMATYGCQECRFGYFVCMECFEKVHQSDSSDEEDSSDEAKDYADSGSDCDSNYSDEDYSEDVKRLPARNKDKTNLLSFVVCHSEVNCYSYSEDDEINIFDSSFDTIAEANQRVRRVMMYGKHYYGYGRKYMEEFLEKNDIVTTSKGEFVIMEIPPGKGSDSRFTVSAMPEMVYSYLIA